MNIKQPECWSVDPQTRGLRVELSPNQTVFMAYHHFVYSEWNVGDTEETLQLNFATHVLVVHGRLLRRIEAALQRMELASISGAHDKFHKLADQNQPFIASIEMVAIDSTTQFKFKTQI